MRRTTDQRSRITVWRTDIGHRGHGLLAYAPMATDARGFGDTAVLATIAGTDGEGADLWAWASAHHQSGAPTDTLARWLICQGWSARLTRSPSRLDFPNVEWHADIEQAVTLNGTGYGHESLALGRLTLGADDTTRAKELLASHRTLASA